MQPQDYQRTNKLQNILYRNKLLRKSVYKKDHKDHKDLVPKIEKDYLNLYKEITRIYTKQKNRKTEFS